MYHFTKNSIFMKTLNSFLISILLILLCSLPFQTTLAGDVPLKPDLDPNTTKGTYQMAPIHIALDVAQNETDITLSFLYPVGIAQITIENENGDVVYQEGVNTFSTLDASIDTQNLDGGVYTLKISYGSTNLAGEFEL
jgi:hypothetical protein